jgi:hypothetical protein
VPFVGVGFAAYFVKQDLKEGNYSEAALDAVGPIPVVGEVAGGYQLVRDSSVAAYHITSDLLTDWSMQLTRMYRGF